MREALQNNCHKHHYAEQRLPGTLLFERKIAFSGLQPRKPFLAFQKGDTFHRMGRGGGVQIWYPLVRAEQGFPLCLGAK